MRAPQSLAERVCSERYAIIQEGLAGEYDAEYIERSASVSCRRQRDLCDSGVFHNCACADIKARAAK